MRHRLIGFVLIPLVLACVVREEPDAALARADSILRASEARANEELVVPVANVDTVALGSGPRVTRLSPLADSIAGRLVFLTYGQRALVAAGRADRLLLDLGRVDYRVETAAQRSAYLQAVAALSPVQIGEQFRMAAGWASEDVEVTAFDLWNGRMVAVLRGSAQADSAVRGRAPVVASVVRADSMTPPVQRRCHYIGSPAMASRSRTVTDSLLAELRLDTLAFSTAQRRAIRTGSSHVHGCFGDGRVIVFASIVVGDHDHVREVAVLIRPSGDAVPLRVLNRRFKAHEALHPLDADGDGVDDIAVRGRARRVGGTAVLRLDVEHRRLEWLGEGFSWETM